MASSSVETQNGAADIENGNEIYKAPAQKSVAEILKVVRLFSSRMFPFDGWHGIQILFIK